MKLFLGLVLGFLLAGCVGATFAWRYYGLQIASYEGKLLEVNPANDADFKICAPDENDKGKCVLMVASDFYAMKQDYFDVQNKLIACEKSKR